MLYKVQRLLCHLATSYPMQNTLGNLYLEDESNINKYNVCLYIVGTRRIVFRELISLVVNLNCNIDQAKSILLLKHSKPEAFLHILVSGS